MSDTSNNLATPIAIVIAGLLVALAVLYTNGAFTGGSGFNTKPISKENEAGTTEGSDYQKYVEIAGEINVEEFEACMAADDSSEIEKDLADASLVGANGTPAFFIGLSTDTGIIQGIPIRGAYPFESFQGVIDGLIEGDNQKVVDALNIDPNNPVPNIEELYMEVSVDDDPVKGDQNAQITIIEFSDYECPFCQRHAIQVLPNIESEYIAQGKVKYVFRDLPLPFHDPIATEAAIAANCVKDQLGDEGYYAFHDEYYSATQSNGKGL